MNDTPDSYVGQGGKVVTVNSTEDGLEFTTGGTGGVGGTASLNKLISTNTITSIKTSGAAAFKLTIPNIQTDGFVTGMTIIGETSGAIGYASAIYGDNTILIYNSLFNNTPFIVGEKISKKLYPVSITDLFGVDKTIETTDEGNILQLKKNVDEKLVYTNVPYVPTQKTISTKGISSVQPNGCLAIIDAELDGFSVGDSIVGQTSNAIGTITNIDDYKIDIDENTRIGNFVRNEKIITFNSKFRLGDLLDVPLNNNTFANKYLRMSSDGVTHEYADIGSMEVQNLFGTLANRPSMPYAGNSVNGTATIHTTTASSKSFFTFSFTNTDTVAQTVNLLVDDVIIYSRELNAGETADLADIFSQPYLVTNSTIKISSTVTTITYHINVIDVLDTALTGFFMHVGSCTGSEQIIRTVRTGTKVKILGECYCNPTPTTTYTISNKYNDVVSLSARKVPAYNQIYLLNQGKTIAPRNTFKITGNNSNVKYLIFGLTLKE